MENTTALNKIHPCFDKEAKGKYARVHIPVAPKCNVQCGYCNRKYDCVNESRPGVTSSVLKPFQALNYIRAISEKIKNVSTIGIAGPGDAFAEPEKTLESIRLIKSEFPEKIFCLSSNGLNILPYIDEIAALNVTHVTVTINSFRLETLEKIYKWARYNKKMYRGVEAAKLMLSQQGAAVKALVEKGIVVKINTVIIPDVNDTEIEEVAKKVSELGATTMNCIPLIPTEGSDMADLEKPTGLSVRNIIRSIHKYIKPMTHCARCRADAAGMLGKDDTSAYKLIEQCSVMPTAIDKTKPHVAVASYEGLMINKHLGEATDFLIYKQLENGYELVERRFAPAKGTGDLRWINLAKTLNDCSYILVNGVGAKPVDLLQKVGIAVVEMSGLIDDGLDAVYKGKKLKSVIKTTLTKCGSSCGGNAMGCG